jgi:hypothetical protein
MHAFMSYQMTDRVFAASVRDVIAPLGFTSFMAHDDLNVSEEWKTRILQELRQADLFVAVLSANYLASAYCMQESGIAVSRKKMIIAPLSLDGTIPPGFMNHIQSIAVSPTTFTTGHIWPSIFKCNKRHAFAQMIKRVGSSGSFRGAEHNFQILRPYLPQANRQEIVDLLVAAADNDQVCHAGLCHSEYLPPLIASHGQFMPAEKRVKLEKVIAGYK